MFLMAIEFAGDPHRINRLEPGDGIQFFTSDAERAAWIAQAPERRTGLNQGEFHDVLDSIGNLPAEDGR